MKEQYGTARLNMLLSSESASKQLTWLALGEDHAARSRRVEQLIALRGL